MRGNLGRRTPARRSALIICAVILAAAGVAACGDSQSTVASPRVTCGSAITHFVTADTKVLSAHRGALACFLTAARHCHRASLGLTAMGVDTGTDYVFAIEPGAGSCQVTEHSRDYSANFGGSHGPETTTTCHLTSITEKGVELRCGRKDVLIPAKVSVPSTHPA